MGNIVILLLIVNLYVPAKSSSFGGNKNTNSFQDTTLTRSIPWENKCTSIALKDIGKCLLLEKDNSIIKNISLKEIHSFWIVYEKDRSLHDILIENISRIEINNSDMVVYFDEAKKPFIKILKAKN